MSDALPISGLVPTGARGTGTGAQPGQPIVLGTVTIEQLPSNLQSLNRQVLLSGQLQPTNTPSGQGQGTNAATGATTGAAGGVPVDGDGDAGTLFRLATSSGDVLIRSSLGLRPGQNFLLQVPAGNPPRGAVLLTAGNQPGATGASGGATAAPPAATAPVAPAAPTLPSVTPLPPLQAGLTTTAQVLPGANVGTPSTTAQALPPGQGTAPAPQPTTAPTAQPSASASAAPPAPAPSAALPNNIATTLLASLLSDANPNSPTARALGGAPTTPTAQPTTNVPSNAPQTGSASNTAPSPSANASASSTAAPASATTASAQAAPAPSTAPPAFPQANNLGDIRILSITRPGEVAPPAPTGSSSGSIFSASVLQSSADGPTLLRLGQQVLLLQARGELPVGSRVTLALPGGPPQLDIGVPRDPFVAGGRWQSLEQASTFLQTVNPTAAQALNTVVPQIGAANLGTTLVFFMAALRLGDVRAWLGEGTMRSLERFGNKELMGKISDEFGRLAGRSEEVLPGNWRPMTVPLAHQGQVGLIDFYFRPIDPDGGRDQEDTGDDAPGDGQNTGGTRFLIDMDMSQLGRMQIDGLAQSGRIDVILRSQTTFPTDMRQELQGLFRDVLDARSLEGGVTFRHNGEGWIKLAQHGKPSSIPNLDALGIAGFRGAGGDGGKPVVA
ncbi:MAG: hypothetical protein KI792_03810 [Alphaproteobacteria bacterium]|nr:hypothetical protein [Alphaproteobacteria bacterium SS10]